MLFLDHARQRLVKRDIRWYREDIRTGHHHLANGDAVEFQCVVDHFFLELGNLADLAARGDDQLQFVR